MLGAVVRNRHFRDGPPGDCPEGYFSAGGVRLLVLVANKKKKKKKGLSMGLGVILPAPR
jgi:hypothetical protein